MTMGNGSNSTVATSTNLMSFCVFFFFKMISISNKWEVGV